MLEFATNTERGSQYGDTVVVQNIIDGELADAEQDNRFPSNNPACIRDVVATAPQSSRKDIAAACVSAREAFAPWRATPPGARVQILHEALALLRKYRHALGTMVSREVGKVRPGGLGDVDDAIRNMAVFLSEAAVSNGELVPTATASMQCRAVLRPVGATAVITPANYPIAIPVWKIVPALLSGNTVVWKPSEEAPACAHLLALVFVAAGLPPGVLNVVHGGGHNAAGMHLLEEVDNRVIRMVSFTGTPGVARRIGETCGRNLVAAVIQTGAKNPFVVMDDVDISSAVSRVMGAAFANTGQRCTSAANLLIHKKVYSQLRNMLVERVEALRMGDPLASGKLDLGPLIGARYMTRFNEHIDWGLDEGASPLYGDGRVREGHTPSGFQGDPALGYYAWPTIWADVDPRMRIAREEVLGPTVNLIPVEDLDEAMSIIAGSESGLTATLLSRDPAHAQRFEEQIDAGIVQINPSGSGGVLPFGGNRSSGNGCRELGRWGFAPFQRWQAVSVGDAAFVPETAPTRPAMQSIGDVSGLGPRGGRLRRDR